MAENLTVKQAKRSREGGMPPLQRCIPSRVSSLQGWIEGKFSSPNMRGHAPFPTAGFLIICAARVHQFPLLRYFSGSGFFSSSPCQKIVTIHQRLPSFINCMLLMPR